MLKLSDQEKQEVIRYLEADKPLPEKYRFLLFGDKREVELVWNGKTNEVCNIVLPFQTIEQVDEPRAEKPSDASLQMGLFSTDERGRQLKGWTNKLIWGDNKLILSSLKNGPLREEIEAQGGLKLIYIDPPFDVGADFSMDTLKANVKSSASKKKNFRRMRKQPWKGWAINSKICRYGKSSGPATTSSRTNGRVSARRKTARWNSRAWPMNARPDVANWR